MKQGMVFSAAALLFAAVPAAAQVTTAKTFVMKPAPAIFMSANRASSSSAR